MDRVRPFSPPALRAVWRHSETGSVTHMFEGGPLRRMQMYADRDTAIADAGVNAQEVADRAVVPGDV
jgi:hypothetical protein